MDLKAIHRFLFHPLSEQHSQEEKIVSVLTITALSIITAGLFTVVFGIENWRTRQISIHKQSPSTFIQNVPASFKKTPSPKHMVVDHRSALAKPFPPTKHQREKAYGKSFRPKEKIFNETKENYLKRTQREHLKGYFEIWAFDKRWEWFKPNPTATSPGAHYDWWMFPVSRSSAGYGDTFAVNFEQINSLKSDEEFIKNYRRGVELVLLSWGWNVKLDRPVPESQRSDAQRWEGYGVRLGKMADSLYLFGEIELYAKVQKFFNHIRHQYPLEQWVIDSCSRQVVQV